MHYIVTQQILYSLTTDSIKDDLFQQLSNYKSAVLKISHFISWTILWGDDVNLHPSKILFHDEKLMFQKTGVLSSAVWFWLKAVTQQKGLVWVHMYKHTDKKQYFLSKDFSEWIAFHTKHFVKKLKSWQQKISLITELN